jgi:hypothetical protein
VEKFEYAKNLRSFVPKKTRKDVKCSADPGISMTAFFVAEIIVVNCGSEEEKED